MRLNKSSIISSVISGICLLHFSAYTLADWWRPAPKTSWQIQLSGKINTSIRVKVYDIDLFDAPKATIDKLHSRGVKVICYFSAGSFEDWREDASAFPLILLGNPLAGWPGEQWLDIRRIDLLAPIMQARLDLAAEKGCDAVDPDNVNGYDNPSGFPLTAEDQLTYNKWLAAEAHSRGLAVGLKNDLNQVGELVAHFDFAVNEQCIQFQECDLLLPFIEANKPVFGIEYKGQKTKICKQAKRLKFDTLIKKRIVGAWRVSCG